MLENKFQSKLIKEIKERFPRAVVLKNDPKYIQGFPDLLVLYFGTWFALECKKNKTAKRQPNQKYYISMLNEMAHAAVVYPENKEDVLHAMEKAFGARRKTCLSRSK